MRLQPLWFTKPLPILNCNLPISPLLSICLLPNPPISFSSSLSTLSAPSASTVASWHVVSPLCCHALFFCLFYVIIISTLNVRLRLGTILTLRAASCPVCSTISITKVKEICQHIENISAWFHLPLDYIQFHYRTAATLEALPYTW